MRKLTILLLTLVSSSVAFAGTTGKTIYSWTDDEGVTHYGDSIPQEFSEKKKAIVNEHGVKVGSIEGRKSEAELAEEQRLEEMRQQRELQRRADEALVSTYLSVDEILMHRDRRVQLWQAQSRVTELYLRNLEHRLESLNKRSRRYQPYSDNPNAPMIDQGLVDDMEETRSTIERHVKNLEKYKQEEAQIIARFEGDIVRFKFLKGIE